MTESSLSHTSDKAISRRSSQTRREASFYCPIGPWAHPRFFFFFKNEQVEEGSVKPVSMDHGTGKVGGYAPIPGQQRLNIRVCRGLWEPWYSWGDVQPCCEPFPLAATVSGLKDPGFIEERDALHSLSQPRESTRRCQCMVLRVFRGENAVSMDLSYR